MAAIIKVSGSTSPEGTTSSDPNFLSFTITLTEAAAAAVTVSYRLWSGTGQAGSDVYSFNSGDSVTFNPGETTKTVTWRVSADTLNEPDEAVVLEVFGATGPAQLDGGAPVLRATGWVLDDDGAGNNLALFTSNPVVVEGQSGNRQAVFDISLSRPAASALSLAYTTVDGSARAGEDYVATSGNLSIAAGQTSARVVVDIIGDTVSEPSDRFTLAFATPAAIAQSSLGEATILDDDAAAVVVSVAGTSNTEGTTSSDPNFLGFAITLSQASATAITVGYRLLSGTAQAGSDVYSFNSGDSVTFAPGQTSQTVLWRIDADSDVETDEAVVLEVYSASGGAALAGNASLLRATGWVLDDDGAGNKLALYSSRPVVVEGDAGTRQANFEVTLSRPAPAAFSMAYTTVDGSARAGEDYTATSGTLSFVAGQTTASVSVPVIGDTVAEPSDGFTLSFTVPASIAQASLGEAIILDDDAGTPTVSVTGASNVEGTTSSDPNFLGFAITLSQASATAITVGYRLLSGTAQTGSDVYSFNSGDSVTFAPGQTSQTVFWRIDADDDVETDEAVVLEVYSASGGAALAGNATLLRATGWVLDDDGAGNKLALYSSRPVVVEGDAGTRQANFEVTLSRPAPAAFSMAYTTVDGSARAGEDYTATSGTLSFVAGQTTASVSVPVIGDTVAEPSDGFTLSFTVPASIAQASLGEAIILDDDAGTPTVSVTGASANEGTTSSDPNSLGFAITLSQASATAVTVGYRLLAGTAGAGTDVYSFNSGDSVTFSPGETSKTVFWRIDGDSEVESDEAVVLELFSVSGGGALAGNAAVLRATGWVLDDDGTGNKLALFSARPVMVESDSGTRQVNFEISLSRPAPEAMEIAYTTADGTARAGQDYVATSGKLQFVKGQTNASVSVEVIGDTVPEPTDSILLSFSAPATIAAVSIGEALVMDDDAATPTVNVTPASNTEATTSSDPNFLTWGITLSEASSTPITVEYRLIGGTAGAGTDVYSFNSGDSVTFAAGETSKTVSFRISGDSLDELDEAVVLEVFSASGGAALAGNAPVLRSTGWVLDDDGSGNPLALYASRPLVVEGDSGIRQANFEISLSRPAPAAFSMTYTTVDGSALAGQDYVAKSGTLNFVAGQTTAGVSVDVIGDAMIEPSDFFTLAFSTPASIANASLGEALILDDDAGTPTVSLTGTSNIEGTTSSDPNFLHFGVLLSEPSSVPVTVAYRLISGTGGAGDDVYSFNSGNSVTFAPGETSKTVSWRINADSDSEPDEAVVLEAYQVSGSAGRLAGDAPVLRATGWVIDDDGSGNKLSIFTSNPVIVEGDSGTRQANFEISLSRPLTAPMTLNYRTLDGTAVAGDDYTATTGTLNLVTGQTQASVSVLVRGDTVLETSDFFTLAFDVPAAAAAASLGEATVLDDDSGTPTVSITGTANLESTTSSDPNFLTFGISLSKASAQPVTVAYRLLSGTATAGTDVYSFNSGDSVTFAPGETFQQVSWRIDGDNVDESDETVVMELTSVSGTARFADGVNALRATGWVLDDDGTGSNLALFVESPQIVEGADGFNRNVGVVARLSRPSDAAIDLAWSTANGSASAGPDYTARSGTLHFEPLQQTAVARVPIIGDAINEADETFTVNVTPSTALSSGTAGTTGTVTILDGDRLPPPATLALEAGANVLIDEGSAFSRALVVSDDEDNGGDGYRYTVDYGDGTLNSGLLVTPALTLNHSWADGPASRTVSVTLTDTDGETATDSFVVTVRNVVPTVTLGGAASVLANQPYTLTLSNYIDPGNDTLANNGIVISWGDGTTTSHNSLGDISHTYSTAGNRNIVVSLIDEDGTHSNVASRAVTVTAPPNTVAIEAGGDAAVNEGSTFSRNISISDGADGGATGWTYSIDYGDGSAMVAGSTTIPSIALSHVYADGAANHTVQVNVTDLPGETASDSFALTVANVAPTASVSGLASINEGAPLYTLSVGAINEPGNDTRSRYTIDWGDGTGAQNFTPAQWLAAGGSFTHLFADGPGNWVINVRATDEDGTHLLGSQAVQVANVVPILTLGGVGSNPESGNYALSISTTEPPSSADVLVYTIDWGDGSAPQTLTAAELRAGAGHAFHVYRDDEDGPVNSTPHTVTVRVDDGDGGTDTATHVVNVTNQAPTAPLSGEFFVNEGSNYTLTIGPVFDQGVDQIQSYRIDWGDGTSDSFSLAQWAAAGGRFNHVFADGVVGAGPRNVVAYATDEDGTFALGSKAVAVVNLNPTLQVTPGPANVNEGGSYTLTLSATDPGGANDPLTYFVLWSDGTAEQTITAAQLAANGGTVSHVFADDQDGPVNATVRDIRVTVTDGDLGGDIENLSVTVNNVAPSLTASGAASATTGVAYTLALSDLIDPGTDTLAFFGITVDWGDGSPSTQANALGNLSHTYTSTGARTIRVSLADEDGSYANVASVAVAVNPPTATLSLEAGADEAIAEGQTLTRTVNFSDGADNGATGWDYRIDYGDGTVVNGNTGTRQLGLDHRYADGDSNRTVTVTVTDAAGESASDSFAVRVGNVAPTAVVTGAAAVAEGAVFTLSVGAVSDPGADVVQRYRIDWGDGTLQDFNAAQWGAAAGSFDHVYADGQANRSIVVSATDEDGTFTLGSHALSVSNAAPTLQLAGSAAAIDEGGLYTLTVSATDPAGSNDPLAYTIQWDDGTPAQTITAAQLAASGGKVSHVFADDQDGPVNATARNISVTVNDGDGGSDTESQAVTVNNVAPSLTAGGANTATAGTAYTLSLSNLVDPGTDALLPNGIQVDWGDGSSSSASSVGDLTHTYSTTGARTIRISLSDEDGRHADVASVALTVNAAPPTLSLEAGANAQLAEGGRLQRTVNFSDGEDNGAPGWTYRIDYGDGTVAQGATATRSVALDHLFADGAANATVSVTVTDEAGESATDSFTVDVANVAPTASLTGAGSVAEGSTYVLGVGTVLDPGLDTRVAYTIAWGDGAVSSFNAGQWAAASGSFSHVYADGPGNATITVSTTDEDGSFVLGSRAVVVNNVVPTLSAGGASSATVGTAYVLALSNYVDPGTDALLANGILVDWGDGSTSTTSSLGSISHTYASAAAYRIRVSLTDEDGSHADVAGVDITVTDVVDPNTAPVAVDDLYSTFAGQLLSLPAPGLLVNDSDADGDALLLASVDSTGLAGTLATLPDGSFSFRPTAGFVGSTGFRYSVSDGQGGSDTGDVRIDVQAPPTQTLRLGDAPVRQSGTGGQWLDAWTAPGVRVLHKADHANAAEPWTAASITGASPQTLAGGDIYQGDLGVSGQSRATSTVRQDLDGSEALRFELSAPATSVTAMLSRLHVNDDGSAFSEGGLLRLIDGAGHVVSELALRAVAPAGSDGLLQVNLSAPGGFVAIELLAGAYQGTQFISGAWVDSNGQFAQGPTLGSDGRLHGSEFMLDGIEFEVVTVGATMPDFGG